MVCNIVRCLHTPKLFGVSLWFHSCYTTLFDTVLLNCNVLYNRNALIKTSLNADVVHVRTEIPEDVHRTLKMEAASYGMNVQELYAEILIEYAHEKNDE